MPTALLPPISWLFVQKLFPQSVAVIILLFYIILSSVSCSNVLSVSAKTNTDAAIIFDAQKQMNKQQYSAALTTLDGLSAGSASKRENIVLRASAYAGLCGLNFINFVKVLQNLETSTPLLQGLLTAMVGKVSYEHCRTAEDLILSVEPNPLSRTIDENLLLALISLSHLGIISEANADLDQDGTADTGFNACTSVSDTDAAEFGRALSLSLLSLGAIGTSVVGNVTSTLASFCGASSYCSQTDTSAFTPIELLAIKSVIHNNDGVFGLGTQTGVICL